VKLSLNFTDRPDPTLPPTIVRITSKMTNKYESTLIRVLTLETHKALLQTRMIPVHATIIEVLLAAQNVKTTNPIAEHLNTKFLDDASNVAKNAQKIPS
jgi:hypothetical protein